MTLDQLQCTLTAEQKGRVSGILSVGCDRETAANYIGCTTADLNRAMQHDAEFAADIHRTEASSELSHMRAIHKAAEDAKNWRAAVWWLEMHAPDRFKPRCAPLVAWQAGPRALSLWRAGDRQICLTIRRSGPAPTATR